MAKGRNSTAKPTLRDLSRALPNLEQARAVGKSLTKDSSSIATAILGTTVIERELEPMLRRRLKHQDQENWNKLTDDTGPLSTFDRKISMGYSLGLFDQVLRDNMHIVRRVRNAFAHAKVLMEFDQESIVKELDRIQLPSKKHSKLYKDLNFCKKVPDPKLKFVGLCFVVANELLRKMNRSSAATARSRRRKLAQLQQAALLSVAGVPESEGGP